MSPRLSALRQPSLRTGSVLALACVLAMLLLSVQALWTAHRLQLRVDRSWALESARQRLSAPLKAGGPELELALGTALETILDGERWGFRYLAVLDGDGQALAARGRYEQLTREGPLPSALRYWLRRQLYSRFGETGRLTLREGPRSLGSLEYAIGSSGRLVRDEAVSRLRSTGLIGGLLALLFGAASLLMLRANRSGGALLLSGRLTSPPETRPPSAAAPATADPNLAESLDRLQIGLLRVDEELRVRAINATACRLTGWTAADALGQLVYTVCHLRDASGAPLNSPAERCLQERRDQPARELRLRPRGGQRGDQQVEASASLCPAAEGGGAAMILQDINARVEARARLQDQLQLAEGVVDHLSEGVLTTDAAGVIRSVNARALRLFGYSAEEMQRMTIPRLLPVPFMNTPGLRLADYVAGGSSRMPKVAGWRKDATTFPAELLVEPMQIGGEERLVVTLRDISERLRSQSLAQRLGRLLDAASEEVYIFDAQSLYFIEVNKGARRNLGLQPEQLSRMSLSSIATDLEPARLQGYLARLRGGESDHLSYKTRHRRADGSTYPVEVRLSFSRDEEPPVFMAIALDSSEREAAEKRLRQLAEFDRLTGLPNRSLLLERLRQALPLAGRGEQQLGLFLIDLDGFRQVNERYGSDTGDLLLRTVADRLGAGLRGVDTVARLGGDEFVVLAPGLRDEGDVLRLAEQIFEQFRAPLSLGADSLPLSASIGVSLAPQDSSDPETLLRQADAALHQARQRGAAQLQRYQTPGDGSGF